MKDKDNQELFIDDTTITNINEYNSIKDEITCEICQGILVKPKQCISCESIFCENCINSWLKKIIHVQKDVLNSKLKIVQD